MKTKFKDLNIGDKFNFKNNIYTKVTEDRAFTNISDIITFWYIFKENDLILQKEEQSELSWH